MIKSADKLVEALLVIVGRKGKQDYSLEVGGRVVQEVDSREDGE